MFCLKSVKINYFINNYVACDEQKLSIESYCKQKLFSKIGGIVFHKKEFENIFFQLKMTTFCLFNEQINTRF